MKHRLLVGARAVARRGGLWIDRYDRQPEARRARLMREFQVRHVFDVGAHRGGYADQLRRSGYRGLISSFEPIPEAFRELASRAGADPRWNTLNVALSNRQGSGTLMRSENEVSSSLRVIRQQHLDAAPASRATHTIAVTVDTVDHRARLHGQPDMLKLDVQGAERDVLEGASSSIDGVNVIEVELSFVELYEGQDLIEDTIAGLRRIGFAPAHVAPGFVDARTGRGLQADGLFVRRGPRDG